MFEGEADLTFRLTGGKISVNDVLAGLFVSINDRAVVRRRLGCVVVAACPAMVNKR